MGEYYILEGKKAVQCDMMTWANWYEKTKDRHVQDERVGEMRISTVFLGLDHSFGEGPPLIFETLVLGGPLDQEMERYSTWEEAEKGHRAMVEKVKKCSSAPPS